MNPFSIASYQPSLLFSTLGGLIVKYNLADASKANRSIVRGHAAGAKEKVLPHILLQVKTGAFDRKKDYIPQVWCTRAFEFCPQH